MPHFVFEYAREIERREDITQIVDALYDVGCESGLMQPEDIKVRGVPFDFYRLRKSGDTFIHVTISLLEGRSDQQKEALAILAREKLSDLLPWVSSISLDVRDMNPTAYKKRLLADA